MDILFAFVPMFLLWLSELLRRRDAEKSVKFWQDLQERSQAQTDAALRGWNETIARLNESNEKLRGDAGNGAPATQKGNKQDGN